MAWKEGWREEREQEEQEEKEGEEKLVPREKPSSSLFRRFAPLLLLPLFLRSRRLR